jgi:hypothetical protein
MATKLCTSYLRAETQIPCDIGNGDFLLRIMVKLDPAVTGISALGLVFRCPSSLFLLDMLLLAFSLLPILLGVNLALG